MCEISFTHFFFLLVKLNGGRSIQGILRGFDPFMNLVMDEGVGRRKDGMEENIGMVVSISKRNVNCHFH